MKLLIDTQALIWLIEGNSKLSENARSAIENPGNELFYSAVTIWEIAIKTSIGKLKLKRRLDASLKSDIDANGFHFLPVEFDHTAEVANLPFHHADPFDRLLVAQCLVEQLSPLSNDAAFDAYRVKRVW